LLTVIVKVTGIDVSTYSNGRLNFEGLLVLSAVLGMGGSFISLAMSKWIAKWTTHAQVIERPSNPTEAWLLDTVRRQADKAGIGRNKALVAVSTGVLRNMDRAEVEAVLGHEVTHVANGDMVTMALIQGVLNTFVIFLARVIGTLVDRAISGNREGGAGFAYFGIVIVLQIVLGFLASLIVMAFPGWRQLRADAGGAHLAGRESMIAALQRLGGNQGQTTLPKAIKAFGISDEGGFMRLLRSHPPIAERVAALRGG